MRSTTTTTPNGLRLLESVKFDRHLCAVLIANRDDWEEILDSIPRDLRKNVAAATVGIRSALGLPTDYDVCQGS
jgi:hypothetical protein